MSPTPPFFIAASYVRQIAEQITRGGARLPGWLLPLRRIGADGELAFAPLSLEQFRRLIADAVALTGDSAFGLRMGERLRADSHGALGYATASSRTLGEALQTLERYTMARATLFAPRLQVRAQVAQLVFDEAAALGAVRATVAEAVVLTLKLTLDEAVLGPSPVSAVAFDFPEPAHAGLAGTLFGAPVRYGAGWTGLELAPSQLDRPLLAANAALLREAVEGCQRELSRRHRGQGMAARVRQILLEGRHGMPGLDAVAAALHLTPRTLHRRLVAEGSAFRELQDELRHQLALEHLRAGRLTLQEIAFVLGYTDLANFRRAFKRWEGAAPSEFRTRLRGATAEAESGEGGEG
jgi:AraC-like DNA-binding protein